MPRKKKKPSLNKFIKQSKRSEHYQPVFNSDTAFGHPGFQTAFNASKWKKKKER
ncbi:MAG: hypothetical protein ACW964_17935 [Candidatus Hodarchaeales archaeon]|jgi:hypothetical protein